MLLKEHFPDGTYVDVAGLSKVATRAEIEAQSWSLNPARYTGSDSFTYTVTDGKTTASATVTVNVSPQPNRAPVAVNDAFTVTQDSAGNLLAVVANDSDLDGDLLTQTQAGAARHQKLSGGLYG